MATKSLDLTSLDFSFRDLRNFNIVILNVQQQYDNYEVQNLHKI